MTNELDAALRRVEQARLAQEQAERDRQEQLDARLALQQLLLDDPTINTVFAHVARKMSKSYPTVLTVPHEEMIARRIVTEIEMRIEWRELKLDKMVACIPVVDNRAQPVGLQLELRTFRFRGEELKGVVRDSKGVIPMGEPEILQNRLETMLSATIGDLPGKGLFYGKAGRIAEEYIIVPYHSRLIPF